MERVRSIFDIGYIIPNLREHQPQKLLVKTSGSIYLSSFSNEKPPYLGYGGPLTPIFSAPGGIRTHNNQLRRIGGSLFL
jgi:hypothetical protein